MLLTYQQIDQLHGTLHQFESLTGEAGFAVWKTIGKIDAEEMTFRKLQFNIFQKYGKDEGDGYRIAPDSENFEKAKAELEELLRREVDVEIRQIPRDKYDPDALYCDSARAVDYRIFETYMVEPEAGDPK